MLQVSSTLHLLNNSITIAIAIIIPAKRENISILSLDMTLSIWENIVDVGVITKTEMLVSLLQKWDIQYLVSDRS